MNESGQLGWLIDMWMNWQKTKLARTMCHGQQEIETPGKSNDWACK